MGDSFSDFFDGTELPDDLLGIFESSESFEQFPPVTPSEDNNGEVGLSVSQKKSNSSFQEWETELESGSTSPKSKRQKVAANSASLDQEGIQDGQQRMSHITMERNRRKQMNEQLSVLRSLMPFFYVKRGDQASIIGGVVDYINELQQILQSLEAKKQRKVYSEVLSPRIVSSPRVLSPLSPRKPPLSPTLKHPISPRTPTPTSPYRPRLQKTAAAAASYNLSPTTIAAPNSSLVLEPSPASSSSSPFENELAANSKSAIADVEVKFPGPNLVLKTVSPRISGQAVKIISALEDLSLEILHVNINTVDETLINSFTIKIGIECELSAEELAQQIQHTFC